MFISKTVNLIKICVRNNFFKKNVNDELTG